MGEKAECHREEVLMDLLIAKYFMEAGKAAGQVYLQVGVEETSVRTMQLMLDAGFNAGPATVSA
jgi:hypothetical protein